MKLITSRKNRKLHDRLVLVNRTSVAVIPISLLLHTIKYIQLLQGKSIPGRGRGTIGCDAVTVMKYFMFTVNTVNNI